ALAKAMVQIGNGAGRKAMAVISDMNQPLGCAVGNALEVKEAIATLQGSGPQDLEELCLTLGSQMVYLGCKEASVDEAGEKLIDSIRASQAFEAIKMFVQPQAGDASFIDETENLPTASYTFTVEAQKDGYVAEIVANEIGHAASMLGAGRLTKQSSIDLAVGLVLNKKVGDKVQIGDDLATIYSNNERVSDVIEKIIASFTMVSEPVERRPLIHAIISGDEKEE